MLLRHDEKPFNDFREKALWRTSLTTAEGLKEKLHHPLLEVTGINAWAIMLDTLHTLDLGVCSHLYGNLLAELQEQRPESREKALQQLNLEIASIYTELGVPAGQRIKVLYQSDIRGKKAEEFPCLKHVKGRRIRHFAQVATVLAERYNTTRAGEHRLKACQAMERVCNILDLRVVVWDAVTKQDFEKQVKTFGLHYGWLAKNAMQNREFKYSIVQKHHLFCHLPEMAKSLTPRHFWCYGSESFMGLSVKLASSCVYGTPGYKVPERMITKYRCAQSLVCRKLVQLEDD